MYIANSTHFFLYALLLRIYL